MPPTRRGGPIQPAWKHALASTRTREARSGMAPCENSAGASAPHETTAASEPQAMHFARSWMAACAWRGVSPQRAIDTTIRIAVDDMVIARWLTVAGCVLGGMSPQRLAAQASVDTTAPPVHVPRV